MSLVAAIADLAARVGLELKGKIDPSYAGLARAWVCFGYVGNQIVVQAAFNVSGVTRTGTGRYRVRFSRAMPDTDYCWVALARSSVNTGTARTAIVRSTSDQKAPDYVDVSCATGATSFSDSTEINLVVYR